MRKKIEKDVYFERQLPSYPIAVELSRPFPTIG